ncbi:hypothetical protein GIB67_005186 [Kingdonia uniflora]|uniref:Bifunctional inhibitor/plant lipid transfer protein/seed storage helical domain-containing protein n=1 Tax=Kingdonia uniflora TaxID=39325 RepID=A0A7J7NNL7_9MAGN|nr:hypothetical protein GIB67_005186 [Kingdonia uniflora]
MMKKVIAVLLVLAMVQLMVEPSQAIDCISVDKNLIQCISFLKGAVPNPPEACCKGVKTLKDTVTTLADKQFACNCVKNAAAQYQDLKDDADPLNWDRKLYLHR